MAAKRRRRQRNLWLVKVAGHDTKLWVVAGGKIESAIRKVYRLVEDDSGNPLPELIRILSIKARGTIDVF